MSLVFLYCHILCHVKSTYHNKNLFLQKVIQSVIAQNNVQSYSAKYMNHIGFVHCFVQRYRLLLLRRAARKTFLHVRSRSFILLQSFLNPFLTSCRYFLQSRRLYFLLQFFKESSMYFFRSYSLSRIARKTFFSSNTVKKINRGSMSPPSTFTKWRARAEAR